MDQPAHGGGWVVDAYHRHARDLFALLGRLGVPAASVEDVVQEVFLILHRRRDEFRGDSSLRTWLHGIAINVARRERARRQRDERASTLAFVPTPPRDPEAMASTQQALARLDRLLDALSDEQREVFVLAEIAELPAPAIAQVTGAALNTVYSRLRLARACLHRILDSQRAEQGASDGH